MNSNSHSSLSSEDQQENLRLIRRNTVQHMTGLSASSIYQLMADDAFPQAVQLSERRVAWVEQEVLQWIKARIKQRQRDEV